MTSFQTGDGAAPGNRPVRVVHVLTSMNRGGIETWLMQVLRSRDPLKIHYELLLLSDEVGSYDQELQQLGIPVWRCPPPQSPLAFARCALRVFKRGHYDAVHSHVHQFSGMVLALARLAGIPGRLAHSHADTRLSDRAGRWPRQLYLRLMKLLVARFSSEGLAVSTQAAASLFGEGWQRPGQRLECRVMPLGIDARPYLEPSDPEASRRPLKIAAEALLVGHVGWFIPEKNHAFLLEVFAEVKRQRPDARLLLIGVGGLMEQVRTQAVELGLQESVIFAGSRSDVPALLHSLDVFVFPSRHEGLGLALIEAQLAGVPCVTASHLPTETHLPGSQLTSLPLDAGAAVWAQAVLAAAESGRRYPTANPFDLSHSTTLFEERYAHYRQ